MGLLSTQSLDFIDSEHSSSNEYSVMFVKEVKCTTTNLPTYVSQYALAAIWTIALVGNESG